MVKCQDCGRPFPDGTLTCWSPRRAPPGETPIRLCDECTTLSRHLHRLTRDLVVLETDIDDLADLNGKVWVSVFFSDGIAYNLEDEDEEVTDDDIHLGLPVGLPVMGS